MLQAQVLNLLQVMVREAKSTNRTMGEAERGIINQTLASKIFFPNLIKGLIAARGFYVRYRYISLIASSVVSLS